MRESWRPNRTATYWPPLLWPSAFLSRSPGMLNRGPGGPASLCAGFLHHILSPTHLTSKLITSCLHPVYIIIWRPLFLWVSQIALIQPAHGQGYILIFFDRMHLLFTQVHFLFWQFGWVGGQYATVWLDHGLNFGLPDHWRILYLLGQWVYIICKQVNWSILDWFHDISTTFAYLRSNPVYTYISNLYNLLIHFVDKISKLARAPYFAHN